MHSFCALFFLQQLLEFLLDAKSTNLTEVFDPMLALRACWIRKRLAVAVFLMVAGVSFLATMRIKPVYESEASLIVRLGRESAGLDPTATTSEITPIYETREQELNSALEVMQSRKLLESVISIIGEDVILDPEKFSFETWQHALETTDWEQLDPKVLHSSNSLHEIAVEKVYRAVTLEVGRSSSVIGVTSTAVTPELAQAITKTLVDAVQAEQVRLNETSGLEFFADEVQAKQQKLHESRKAINDLKNRLRLTTLEGERTRLEDVMTTMEKELNSLRPKHAGAIEAVRVMTEEVANMPNRTQPNDATDMLSKKLHELELMQTTMLTKFTPKHFRVRDLNKEIERVRQQLSDPKNRNAANPTLRELEVTLSSERVKIAETSAQIREYEASISSLHSQLTNLNNAEAEMLTLRDRQSEQIAALAKATQKYEQAAVLDRLSKKRISNIRIVQPATFNPVSASAPRSLVLLAGLFVGCIAAVVVPAIVEFAAWYLRTLQSENQNNNEEAYSGPTSEELVPCG